MAKLPERTSAPDFQLTPAIAEQLTHAVQCAARENASSMCDLQSAVEFAAREMQAAGLSPEAMLIVLKAQFHESLLGFGSSNEVFRFAQEELLEEVVKWAIDAYYGSEKHRATA
jgi:hypothetical protein